MAASLLAVVSLGCGAGAYTLSHADDGQVAAAQSQLRDELDQAWATQAGPAATPATPGTKPGTSAKLPAAKNKPGAAVALLRIPRLGPDWAYAVVEGAVGNFDTLAALKEGPAHFPESALPGQVGNFAVAAHRWGGHGFFHDLPELRTGDTITVEDASATYTYTVTGSETVKPSNTTPIAPVPGNWDAKPTRKLLTLITCTPIYVASERLAVHAELTATTAKTTPKTAR